MAGPDLAGGGGRRFWRRFGLWLGGAALAGTALLSAWYGVGGAWSDAVTLQSRWRVSQWRAGEGPAVNEAQWTQVLADLQAGLQIAPDNAQLLDDLGFLNASRAEALGITTAGTPEHTLQQALLASAIASYRSATRARPTFAYDWAYLALAKQLRGEIDAELWLALDKALQYGSTEPGVQLALARVAFANWRALGAPRQARLRAMVASAPPDTRQRLLAMAQERGVVLAAR